jgi:thiol:disulfide interchange protein DsbC
LKVSSMATLILAPLLFSSQVLEAGPKEIRQKLKQSMPRLEVTAIRPTPVQDLYEVEVGMQVAYVTGNGKHLIIGKMIDVNSKKNLTESREEELLATLVKSLGTKDMITIKPKKVKRSITVFTDVDCPYCSKLHLEVPKLTKAGVSVRYLLYPRNGPQSATFHKSVSVWCADDQIEAIGKAKRGERIEQKKCDNPVTKNFNLGRRIGISGTPTIILDNGKKLGGYLPADHLLKQMGL